jgi:hypothetical protein
MGLRLEALETRLLLSAAVPGSTFEGPELFDLPGEEQGTTPVHPDRMIVGYDPESVGSAEEILQSLPGASIRQEFRSSSAMVVQLPAETKVSEAVDVFSRSPGVRYAEPDYLYQAQVVPDDPMLNSLWGLHNIGQTGGTLDADIDAPEAWDFTTGSENVLVGVVDTGVDTAHADLRENIWVNAGEIAGDGLDNDGNGYVDDLNGWDFYENTNDPSDQQGHGTHVAGTIGAVGDNGEGVVGVNWNVQIGALAIGIEDTGFVSVSAAVEAVEYATDMGFDILNMSWGGTGVASTALYDAIEAAGEEELLVVAAAGNASSNNDLNPAYPASFELDNVISVAATTHNDQMAGFSNFGATSVDLAAPGQAIFSTRMGGGYVTMSGTSMASPHVAGVAALLRAHNPAARVEDLRSALLDGTDVLSSLQGLVATGGRLNANNAIAQMWTPVEGVDLELTQTEITPDDLFGAREVDIDFTVRNFGDTGFEDSISVEFYLSDNNVIDGSDILLSSYNIDGMEPTGIVSDTVHVGEFPSDDPFETDGFYFMLGVVDPDDVVEEIDEENNSISQNVSWARRAIQEDDFSTDTGWTGFAPNRWERGPAMAGGGEFGFPDPAQDTTATDDNMLLGYHIGGDYENSISAPRWITSPVIDCSDFRDVNFSFQRWLNVESNVFDEASIEVYDGTRWTQLWSNPGFAVTDQNWTLQEFDVSSYADENGEFQVRFGIGPTDFSWRYSGWNIDDFVVSGKPERDFAPPQVESINVEQMNLRPVDHIQIEFNEEIPERILTDTANYELVASQWGPIAIDSAAADTDSVVIEINRGNALPQDSYTLTVRSGGIEDEWGNALDGNSDGNGGDDFVFEFSTKLAGGFAGALEPTYGGRITFYDTNYRPGDLEIDARPAAWVMGGPQTGITAVGLLPQYTDFGVVIEQAPHSDQPIAIYDQTFSERPITFIVTDSEVSELQINSRLNGRDLNGLYLGSGLRLADDVDGDGELQDPSGFIGAQGVRLANLQRSPMADFVTGDDVDTLVINGVRSVEGETTVGGDLGLVYSRPSLDASLRALGRIDTAILAAGTTAEGRIFAGAGTGDITSYGALLGGAAVVGDAESIMVHGDVGGAEDGGAGDIVVSDDLGRLTVANGSITASGDGPRIDVGDEMGALEIYNGDLWGGVRTGGAAGRILVQSGAIGVADGDRPAIEVGGGGLGDLLVYGGWINPMESGAQIQVTGDLKSALIYGDLHGAIEITRANGVAEAMGSTGGNLGQLVAFGVFDAAVEAAGRVDEMYALNGMGPEASITADGGGGEFLSVGTMAGRLESGATWQSVSVLQGDLMGTVDVENGDLGSLYVLEGSMGRSGTGTASVNVDGHLGEVVLFGDGMYADTAAGSVGSVRLYGRGSLYGTLSSEGSMDQLYVSGDIRGEVDGVDRIREVVVDGNLLGAVRGGSLGTVSVGSDLDGATLTARTGGLARLEVTSDVRNSEISAAGLLQVVSIRGDFRESNLLAERLESVSVGDTIRGTDGHEIRAEAGWFSLQNGASSWLITEDDDRTIGGVHVHVTA